jgi:regulatory protein
MRRAGTVLARRARSEAELARSLAPVAPPEIVEGVLDDLRALGYLDDTALACALAERRLASGWGALRVQADLERLEIAGEAARAGLEAAAAGEAPAGAPRARSGHPAQCLPARAPRLRRGRRRSAPGPRSRVTPRALRDARRQGYDAAGYIRIICRQKARR